jgi:D-aminoacyl-tRNA deacylase
MKALLQRVDKASVIIENNIISSIEKGILVFLGVAEGDDQKDADYLVEKIVNLRIYEDENNKMNLSIIDICGELLVISQFTLMADCRKGRRPSFTKAEKPENAIILYDYFVEKIKKLIPGVSTGVFQAMMKIQLINDGPVTIMLDSKDDKR